MIASAKGTKGTKRPHYGQYLPSITSRGYVRVYRPGHPMADRWGYALEHRYVMWESGVDPTGKHVHHINGDKTDNGLENLEVVDVSEHHRHHIREAGVVTNQFGVWPVATTEEERQERRRSNARRRAAAT